MLAMQPCNTLRIFSGHSLETNPTSPGSSCDIGTFFSIFNPVLSFAQLHATCNFRLSLSSFQSSSTSRLPLFPTTILSSFRGNLNNLPLASTKSSLSPLTAPSRYRQTRDQEAGSGFDRSIFLLFFFFLDTHLLALLQSSRCSVRQTPDRRHRNSQPHLGHRQPE